MDTLSKSIGSRIRTYRMQQGLTQEQLAEKANMHNTYVGQVERGEKNLTIVSLERILNALDVSFPEFFQCMELTNGKPSYAAQCYDLVHRQGTAEQARMYHILWEVEQLMKTPRLDFGGI